MANSDDLRQFTRELVTRLERVLRDQAKMFERLEAGLDAQSRALGAMTDELRESREENREEHRAQREALFHILDRLQNGGAQA